MKAVKTSGGGTVGYSPTAAAGGLLGEVGASCGADRPPPVVDRVKSNDNAGVDSSSTRLAQGGLLLQRRSTPDHDSPRFRVPAAASGAGTVAVGSPARVARRMSPFVREGLTASLTRISEGPSSQNVMGGSHQLRASLAKPPAGGLKRKRPPQLSISSDICTHSAGATLALATERDMKDAAAEEVTLEGATFALSSKRGRRRNSVCEDAYRAAPGLDGDPTQGIFSVFDGHGGRAAAEYAAEHLHTNILSEVHADPVAGADLEGSIDAVKAAMIRGFLATDRGFLAEGTRSGATATTAYMRGGVVWVANVGDCRAVVSEGGVAAALTRDHRPDRAEERRLVERRGGEVVCILGTSRVQGVLGVSRAIGDKDLKQYITAEPEVYAGPISDVAEFLIIGTDGLWDVVGNQEAIDVVRDCLGLATVSEGAAGAAGVGVGVGSGGGAGAGAVAPREKSPTSPDRVGGAAAPPPPDWGDSRGAEDGSPGGSGSGGSGGSGGGELEGPRGANLRAGPTDRACKALVEMARARGSRDDISVLIVELSTYAQGGTPVSTPGDDASDSAGSPNVSTPQPSPSSGSGGGSGKTGAGGGKADGGVAGQAA